MTDNEKLTVIAFDETYISNRICYDKKNEQVIGPHRCVQTAVVRGIVLNVEFNYFNIFNDYPNIYIKLIFRSCK